MTARVNKRFATRSDLIALFGELPPVTVRAQVWEDGDELLGIAGYWTDGQVAVVFSDIKKDAKVPAVTIFRAALSFLETLDRDAVCVADNENAERFLQRLGWKHASTVEQGEVYLWQLSSQQ